MTHKELVDEIAKRLNWTNDKVLETVGASVEIIGNELSEGNAVSIQDFGVFNTELKSEYIEIDTETMERFLVPPKIEISFNPSNTVREQFEKIKNN